jgi:protease-4
MYARRHPYLFFLLVAAALGAVTTLGLSGLFMLGGDRVEFDFGEKVGVVEISGVIVDAREAIDQIKQLREEESIKAIVVRINSPGGAVQYPSERMITTVRPFTAFAA